ncbi:MAG: copper chaperone PCu(A)C [Sulfurospirillaceae bacterium]|nr:copper chaperone PCu(A)C [Sulfurospirillaceae bacterium]MDD2826478.1 copper chaperone PCu(A)C [Sulfurospirillaceae bacterium]
MLKHTFAVYIFLFTTALYSSSIEVIDAYIRAVPIGLPNSAAFMKIKNSSNKIVYLQKVVSTSAEKLELHEHVMSGAMMKMQHIPTIEIPANTTVELKPGGLHVMLLGLTKPLVVDDFINDFSLFFSNGDVIQLKHLPIKSAMNEMKH